MRTMFLTRLSCFFLLVLLLAGCTGGPRPDPRVVVLSSTAAAVPATETRMGRIEVAEYLQRRHPVWRMSETQLVERRGQYWGERLEAGIRRVLEAELGALRPTMPAGALYDVRIDRFEPAPDGQVALWAGWQLSAGAGEALRSGRFQASEALSPGTGEGAEAAAMAAAMSRLLGQLAQEMAAR
ncbi:PqiC family protein [Oceanibaculum indicum]|nr:ABC-type transport auxiliary lipoprotein family protein [Oceanibaculum indicum]